jgi:iron complex outermembrane receptor protein
LLTVQIAPGPPPVTANINASPTIMQGVEFGLNTLLWREGGRSAASAPQGEFNHQLTLRQAYTFNDFYFEHDSIFRGNKLPGLPDHFYQGELLYEHPIGVFFGFKAQIASTYQADYANTFTVPSYAIFGASLGYRLPKKGFDVHLEARNLTNEKYVTAISPTYNMAGKDSAVFGPGDGLGLFGGFSYQY